MSKEQMLINFLEDSRTDIDRWKDIDYDEILEMDNKFLKVWDYNFLELCKIHGENLKKEFSKRLKLSPQKKRLIEIEITNISLKKYFEYAYFFCIDNKLYADNHSLFSFVREEIYGTQPQKNNIFKIGYEKNFNSFIRVAEYCLLNGAYATYEPFIELQAKKHDISIDNIIGTTYDEILERDRFGSNDNEFTIDKLIEKAIEEVDKIKPINLSGVIEKQYNIELIKNYLSRGRIDDFIEIIDLVYDIVKNKGTENIKECKNQVRYTIHLLIKNGWVQNNVKPKGRFIQAFNLFFGFKTNKNDLAAFDFPTTESRSLINTDYNSKFILVYEKLKDAVRIDSVE